MSSLLEMSFPCTGELRRLLLLVVVGVLEILWVSENAHSTSLTNLANGRHIERVGNRASPDHMSGREPRTCISIRGDWAATYYASTVHPRCNSRNGNCHRYFGIQRTQTAQQTQLRRPHAWKSFRRLQGTRTLAARTLAGDNQTGSTQDRAALVALKKSLIADTGADTNYGAPVLATWNSTTNPDVCSGWEGILCNSAGRVTVLNISYVTLGGEIGWDLGNLTMLEILRLRICRLEGQIPRSLAKLISLREIDLAGNLFEGPFPDVVFGLPKLRVLDLSSNPYPNSFTGVNLSGVKNLVNLEILHLANIGATGTFPEEVLSLSNLRSLDLSMNSFPGSIPSGPWISKHLEFFRVAESQLNGTIPETLLSFPKLRYLDLTINNLTGVVPDGLPMLQLQNLWLYQNNLGGTFPKAVLSSINLQRVDLYDNKFEGVLPEAMGNMSNLRSLILSGNSFSGIIPEAVFTSSTLSHLDLSSNAFSGTVPTEGQAWIQLESLDLSYNSFNGTFPQAVLRATKLTYLNLGNNSFTGRLPLGLQGLTQLQYLSLSTNSFSGQFPGGVLKMTNLTQLYLDHNSFSGVIPSGLRLLTGMLILQLNNNGFNGTFPGEVWSLTKLMALTLNNNFFTGTISSSLSNLTGLLTLDLSENFFTGRLPSEMGYLRSLKMLNLAGNNFSGDVPYSLGNCTDLLFVDLSDNSLTGISGSFNLAALRVLQLNANKLSGEIPSWIWRLPQLQILDLSRNAFERHIRDDLIVWNGMNRTANDTNSIRYLFPNGLRIIYKGNLLTLNYLLQKMASIDLSENQLSGTIPNRFMEFKSLQGLNLSHNKFTSFPNDSSGYVAELQSLDISFNQISGTIPSSLGDLNSLGVLRLSGNNFSGPIPTNGHLFDVNSSVFLPGNPYLCGKPLNNSCPTASPDYAPPSTSSGEDDDFLSFPALGIGAAIGFLWAGALLIWHRPRHALFRLMKLPLERSQSFNGNYNRQYGLFKD